MPTLRSQIKSRPVTRQKDQKVINPRAADKKKNKQQDNNTRPATRRTRGQIKVTETEIQSDADQTPRILTNEVQQEQARETEIPSDGDQTPRSLTNEVQQEQARETGIQRNEDLTPGPTNEVQQALPSRLSEQSGAEARETGGIQSDEDETSSRSNEIQKDQNVFQSKHSEQCVAEQTPSTLTYEAYEEQAAENQTVECEEPQMSKATSSGECQLIDNSRPDLVLGQLDAHFTKMFIDVGMKSSHKYCAPPEDFFAFVQNPKVRPLSEQLMQSYASSFEYVKYQEEDGYFSDKKEVCVKARKNFPKK